MNQGWMNQGWMNQDMLNRGKGAMALILSAVLCAPPVSAQSTAEGRPAESPKHRPAYRPGQLQQDQRILHALNRFTFGARPGDLEAVKAMGLDAWFEQQLHPSSIDNDNLDARLAAFPAMQWNPDDLLYRLPSDARIRQAADGKVAFPQTGALHAIYANQLDRYALRKEAKQEKAQLASASTANATPTAAPMNTAVQGAQMQSAPMQSGQTGESQTSQTTMAAADNQPEAPPFDSVEAARILALPPARRMARIESLSQWEFDSFRKSLKPAQRTALLAGLNPEEKEIVAALENPKNLVNDELCQQRLVRDIVSNAQLQEVMTDFWMNHFNVFLHKNDETPYYLVSYERDVIRPRALGKFEDLLEATAHSPAMLLYLDNSSSVGPSSRAAEHSNKKDRQGLNENYARELMELHTLGVNGGYTQKDVTEVARVFTGWTVDQPAAGGPFRFNENRHDPGSKLVLGKKIKERGEREGEEVLHLLATRPATAQFLSRKLAIRFVGDEPPQALVDRMAKSYLSSGGNISAVLRTLFQSPEFWSADAYRAKVKTPLEFVVSSVRASGADIDNLQPLVNALKGMGMPLYGAVPPTGYSWQSSAWVSAGALVNRMNFALLLASNKFGGLPAGWLERSGTTVSPPAALTGPTPVEILAPEAEERRIEALLVAGGVSDSTRAAVLEQLRTQQAQDGANATGNAKGDSASPSGRPVYPAQAAKDLEKQDQLLAGLLLGSPEFQRR